MQNSYTIARKICIILYRKFDTKSFYRFSILFVQVFLWSVVIFKHSHKRTHIHICNMCDTFAISPNDSNLPSKQMRVKKHTHTHIHRLLLFVQLSVFVRTVKSSKARLICTKHVCNICLLTLFRRLLLAKLGTQSTFGRPHSSRREANTKTTKNKK